MLTLVVYWNTVKYVLCLKALLLLTFKGLLLALVVYRDTCAAFKRTANILIQGFSAEVLKRVLCQALLDRNMLEISSLLPPLLNSDG